MLLIYIYINKCLTGKNISITDLCRSPVSTIVQVFSLPKTQPWINFKMTCDCQTVIKLACL